MYVCMCVIVVTIRGWGGVGLWAAVSFLAKISLHIPTCKTTFARLTQSQAILQSVRVFITFRWIRDTTFFSFFETLFYTKLLFPLQWWSKDFVPGGQAAGGGRSTSKSTCEVPAWTLTAFGDWPAPSMSKFSASVNSDLWVWSYQVTSDLRDVYFLDMHTSLALVVSESSFCVYVCLRRPAGLHRDERSCGCHDGHYKVLSRCRLVGSCVLLGENFFFSWSMLIEVGWNRLAITDVLSLLFFFRACLWDFAAIHGDASSDSSAREISFSTAVPEVGCTPSNVLALRSLFVVSTATTGGEGEDGGGKGKKTHQKAFQAIAWLLCFLCLTESASACPKRAFPYPRCPDSESASWSPPPLWWAKRRTRPSTS